MNTTHLSVSITILAALGLNSQAAVVTDGSLGQAGALHGPAYHIDAALGHQQGGNLFHSFSQFSLYSGESATFSGADSVHNIISRVTGGELSHIDGQLSSSIAGANLYLFNPAGVYFGANAHLNLSGSFYVSTAQYLNFADGQQFSTQELHNSQFSTAQPSAFGFLAAPQAIHLDSSQLALDTNQTLHLSGGDIQINNSSLDIAGGTLALHSGASQGEVNLNNFTDSFTQRGKLHSQSSTFSLFANGSGNAYLSAKNIQLSDGYLDLETIDADGGVLQIKANDLILDFFDIYTATSGLGTGANTNIQATGLVQLHNQSNILSGSCFVSACEQAQFSGNSGHVEIQAEQLHLLGSSTIAATTQGGGKGGDIIIQAQQAQLTGTDTYIASDAGSLGDTGRISLHIKDSISIQNNARIQSVTAGNGNSQGIALHTNALTLSNPNDIDFANTQISTQTQGSGQAGNIDIQANRIEAFDGTRITSETFASGNAGNISINTQQLQLSGQNINNSTAITSASRNPASGNSGSVNIQAEDITLLDRSNIGNLTEASGHGGNINIQTSRLHLSNKADINAESRSTNSNAGDAGSIALTVTDQLTLSNQAQITTASKQAGGGQISLNNQNLLYLNDSAITTSVQVGSGNGGDISINQPEFVTLNQGRIIAQAIDGNGGNIFIQSDQFISSTLSLIDASSQRGLDGNVVIDSPNNTAFNELARLPSDFLKSDELSRSPCGTQTADQSRFLIRRREGMPNAADDWLPSDPVL